ncbi:hypothetical protein DJ018_13130 [Phenylobacterium deserti]|uniref:Uncharacterized protein n=1 Tax=Phenylobacterium deserti TaxID=1914756 RepID=A0A328ABJ9_9CAUL|nr:hypothetical protein DJ018_13130 [Phenylobacterium deserti]
MTTKRSRSAEAAFYQTLGTRGRVLFGRMLERADGDPAYARQLTHWLFHDSTVALYALAEPFGDWHDNAHFNGIASIDSAHLHARAMLRALRATGQSETSERGQGPTSAHDSCGRPK